MPSSAGQTSARSEEHTSELHSHDNLVCRLLLEKKHPHRRHAHPPQRPRGARHKRNDPPPRSLHALLDFNDQTPPQDPSPLFPFVFFFLNFAAPPDPSFFPPRAPFPV